MKSPTIIHIDADLAGQTLAAVLRHALGEVSWSEARRLIASRRVRVNGSVCLDDARRLKSGETIEAGDKSPTPAPAVNVKIIHRDEDLVVVDKPPGLQTVRRIEERNWSPERKARQPVLEELVTNLLLPAKRTNRLGNPRRLRSVHRLDRDTSGLMLFALSAAAEQELIRRFARHDIDRVYRAVVHGIIARPKTIESHLVRDRGDGIRGSTPPGNLPPDAQHAVTHIRPIEPIGSGYTMIECRLETGRTHQIRIHLAEIGHMLCGEKVYLRPSLNSPATADISEAPRQALHSTTLEFQHPTTKRMMRFESPWPPDLARWMERLRTQGPTS